MPKPDPIGEIEKLIVKVATAAMTFIAAAGVLGHEWSRVFGSGYRIESVGVVLAALMFALATRRLRR